MEAVITKSEKLESDITDLVTDVYDLFSEIKDDDIEASTTALDLYIKHTARIGLRIHKSGFIILQDMCVTFQDILRQRREQNSPLSHEEREQLEIWPALLLSHITDPDNPEHIEKISDFIENPIWSQQITIKNSRDINVTYDPVENDASQSLETNDNTINITDDEPFSSQKLFDDALYESIQQEILESTSDLITELLSFTESNNDSTHKEPLELCADRIETLALSMTSMGYMGIMDACMYFQLGLRSLATHDEAVSTETISSIEEWPGLILSYFASPDEESSKELIDFLVTTTWIPPLSDMDVNTLQDLLILENIALDTVTQELANNTNPEVSSPEANTTAVEESIDLTVEDVSNERINFLADELVNLVIEEIKLEKEALSTQLNILQSGNEIEIVNKTLTDYKSNIERFLLAIESIGLDGLLIIFNHINESLAHWQADEQSPPEDCLDFMSLWPDLTINYLGNYSDKDIVGSLVDNFIKPSWPIDFQQDRSELFDSLLSPSIAIEEDTEQRAITATADDISLALPEDVNQQLLNSLLHELPIQTAEFTLAVTKIIDGVASSNDIEQAQRIAHTLKGAANTVGIVGIATLTHHLEDILTAFNKHNTLPGKSLADILINAADVLEMMSEFLSGIGDKPEQALGVLQQVLDWANRIDKHGIPEDDTNTVLSPQEENQDQYAQEAVSNIETQPDENMVQTMLHVPAALMDELLRLAGESIILGAQLKERLNQATKNNELAHEHNTHVQQLIFDLEQIVDIQRMTSTQSQSELTNVFDALELEQYNELHSITHQLVEASTDTRELSQNMSDELNQLDSLLADQGRIHKESQDMVMQTRMVPIQNIIPRLQRSIRQTCRYTGKKAKLDIHGTDTLIDSDILNDLAEPLMHILRNAIDHGIEIPDTRINKDKPESGTIHLDFRRDGDHIVIRCSDDGAGLDFAAIKSAAIEKGLLDSNIDVSDEELSRIIWLPGFSTSKETTQVSGRGIGMDAVFNSINTMKGTLNIESEKNAGCTVEIRLPLTLISVHAILIKNREQTIAVSNRGIEQILNVSDGNLTGNDDQLYFEHNDTSYKVYDIENLLYQPTITNPALRDDRSIILLRDETGTQYAITVEQLISNEDLIVKQLGQYVPEISGIEGATILGNGNIVPVLDLPGLIRTISDHSHSPVFDIDSLAEIDTMNKKVRALVVDDSLSARRALAEFVEDIGYEVNTARDGIEAIEIINDKLPDILLVDLEMPRMNGLELTSHLRSGSSTKDIPIIMVTSRSTEKHREMAFSLGINAYITKPFSEGELFDEIDNLLSNTNPA